MAPGALLRTITVFGEQLDITDPPMWRSALPGGRRIANVSSARLTNYRGDATTFARTGMTPWVLALTGPRGRRRSGFPRTATRAGNTVTGHSVEGDAVYRREQLPVKKAR